MEERVSRGEERYGIFSPVESIVFKKCQHLLKRGIKDTERKFKEKRGFVRQLHKHPS